MAYELERFINKKVGSPHLRMTPTREGGLVYELKSCMQAFELLLELMFLISNLSLYLEYSILAISQRMLTDLFRIIKPT